jgi:uncharacterized phage protein gp47/JayE
MALATLAFTITAAGITAPSFDEILADLEEQFRTIYGADAYIAPDSQDGQWIAALAKAIDDMNQAAIKLYNSFSPTFAQGNELSSLVKINGIRRRAATKSTAVGNVVGQSGTTINSGSVKDANGNIWDLPAVVQIPVGGSISVTVTAREAGAVNAASGTINVINTPTLGWQTFASTADAVPGEPVETDAALRRRQSASASLPANTPLAALFAAVANLEGVTRVRMYENPTGAVDANGLPAHSISAVVEGGVLQEIVDTIGAKKTPGAATYGTTSGVYTDPITGIPYDIDYFTLANENIKVNIEITPLAGYSSALEPRIKQAVADYLNSLEIGEDVIYTRMFQPAYLNGDPDGATYAIDVLEIALVANPFGVVDIPIAFNKAAMCVVANVTVTT